MIANYIDAIKDFTRAIEMRSEESANDYQWRGRAYYLSGNCDLAIKDLTKAMEVRGEDHANDYHWRGEAYYTKGDHDAAAKDTEKALQLNLGSEGAERLKELSRLTKKDI
jgi:tetratricopeptide (TPR) repeat protein